MSTSQEPKKDYAPIVTTIFIVIAGIIGGIILIFTTLNSNHHIPQNGESDFIEVTSIEDLAPNLQTGKIYSTLEDVEKDFEIDSTDDFDFENNSYALVVVYYNIFSQKDVTPDYYTYEDSDHIKVGISYTELCSEGGVYRDFAYYLIPVAPDTQKIQITKETTPRNSACEESNNLYEVKKPIIYLYPTSTIDVTVKLAHPELITSSYPKYQDVWQVTADPTGKLIDKTTGRELYSLYWEGANRNAKMHEDGFIVKGADMASFLEAKLAKLGLTDREAEEFIIYWLPILEQNNYNYIRFETLAEINSYMPLEINPNPDTLIRVIMDYKPLDAPIDVSEQKLTTPTRTGFTVVEWGGVKLWAKPPKNPTRFEKPCPSSAVFFPPSPRSMAYGVALIASTPTIWLG